MGGVLGLCDLRNASALSGLPVTHAVQAAELLAGGGYVEGLAPRGEAVRDRGAVLGGLVVVVLELGDHIDDVQAQPADAGQHAAVRRLVHQYGGVVAVRLEVGELAAQEFGLVLGESTMWAWQVN